MKKAIIIAIVGALAAVNASAGGWGGKAPIAPKGPIEPACEDVGGTLSAGYATDYIFYGQRRGRDNVWTGIDYTLDLGVPITLGALYLNEINPHPNRLGVGVDRLDLYGSVGLPSIAGFDAALTYTRYIFPSINGPVGPDTFQNEFGIDLSKDIGFATLVAQTNYNAQVAGIGGARGDGGWYHQAGIEKGIDITDALGAVLAAGVGYSDNYFGGPVGAATLPAGGRDSGWNHYYINLSLPIVLGCNATLTPYVGYVGAPGGWVQDGAIGEAAGIGQSDILHGGVSLSVGF